jgi:NADPH2:quinone reductase
MKTKGYSITEQGAPSVLQFKDLELGEPKAGEIGIRQTAVGLNYIDVYHRGGQYPMTLPTGIGSEAAGIVESIGDGVDQFGVGDRVAYAGGLPGAYCERRVVPTAKVIKLADDITDQQAAAVLLKGMTVEYLLNRVYQVKSGEKILFHAAAGGVGLIAGQWATALGAEAIGVAGGPEKCALAKDHGYAHVIDRKADDVVAKVMSITGNAGVPVVYDSVGEATFEQSIDCLAPRGLFVSFGSTTGEAPAVAPSLLQKKGSLYFTRPTLVTYTASRAELEQSAHAVFEMLRTAKINVKINQTYPLKDAAKAHTDLEAGNTIGSTLLIP